MGTADYKEEAADVKKYEAALVAAEAKYANSKVVVVDAEKEVTAGTELSESKDDKFTVNHSRIIVAAVIVGVCMTGSAIFFAIKCRKPTDGSVEMGSGEKAEGAEEGGVDDMYTRFLGDERE